MTGMIKMKLPFGSVAERSLSINRFARNRTNNNKSKRIYY